MSKIDLIIDVLERMTRGDYRPFLTKEALAAARELRELKPVAWRVGEINFYTEDVAKAQSHTKKQPLFSLYALEEVPK
jgi:hypothetical protein